MEVFNTHDICALENQIIEKGEGAIIAGHEEWEDLEFFIQTTKDILRKHIESILAVHVDIKTLDVPDKPTHKEFVCTEKRDGGRIVPLKPYMPSTPHGLLLPV